MGYHSYFGLIGLTAFDLYAQGVAVLGNDNSEIIGEADGYDAMLKGTLFAFGLAVGCASWTGTDTQTIIVRPTGASRLSEALGFGVRIELDRPLQNFKPPNTGSVLDNAISPAWYPSLIFILLPLRICDRNLIWNNGNIDALGHPLVSKLVQISTLHLRFLQQS